ncbi:Polynucleotide 5'-hydroxyl-kinase GRC3 [Daldinia childiae]|uniref:Polynucleotide 5'-hydroxyl-kinase GRC3 n=1 Tax=Daldinia childiae TaxID=326645 RepID=UPI0014461843|nr:Polynucleotide 5'-hydroxyl-kinase GRC3 [Daldinia childiae]KAF3067364.1 Polynucleotide 5'-hydroxyl-kinase GRC3 [Daldinia childiae]
MSAFALRKRLLGQQITTTSPNVNAADETILVPKVPSSLDTSGTSKTRSPKKTRKTPNVQSLSSVDNEPSIDVKDTLSGNSSPFKDDTIILSSPNVPSRSPSPSIADDEILVRSAKALSVHLSNFKPSKSNYQKRKDGRILLKLLDGERLVILGSYGIRVKSGEITLNGAILRISDRVHWVNAPHCHALPVIRCSNDASLELLPHPTASGLRSLGKLAPQFRKLWNESSISSNKNSVSPYTTFLILYTSADGPKKTILQDLVSPPEWNREIAKLVDIASSKPSSFMITGPKSSGKSTFGKLLANRLITDQSSSSKRRVHRGVAVLDLDPGQPEYCVAGQVALVFLTEPVFSPSFCRPLPCPELQIIRSHALASISPASDPELYLEAAMDLMTHYRNVLGRYPLIINTPGWIQGTGLDLLTSLITSSRPTEVLYMSESGPAEVVEALQESCRTTTFSTLPSQASQLASRTAAHLRSMQTMSYFHAESQSSSVDGHWVRWNNKPLITVPPWQVSYKGPERGIFGIMCYDYQTPMDLLADSVNGTIVAVVGIENAQAFRHREEHDMLSNDTTSDTMDIDRVEDGPQKSMSSSFLALARDVIITTPEGIPFIDTTNGITLNPKFSHSLGLALVRGIDVKNGVLQLLTPLGPEKIEEITSRGGEIVLVSGKFDTPSWAYTEELYYRAHEEADDGEDADETTNTNDDAGDISEAENVDLAGSTDTTLVPWVEVLHGNQKRGIGSKVWRVRRDLGRVGNATK